MNNKGLAYVGRIVRLDSIEGADNIVSVHLRCGRGGLWRAVVTKGAYSLDDLCLVFLPDAIVPSSDGRFACLAKHNWRIKMMRFKGAPSEVFVIPLDRLREEGEDITDEFNISKYVKPHFFKTGDIVADFPSFIRKTDEDNFQRVPHEVERLRGKPFYVAHKMDGCSVTAYKRNGKVAVCSRNYELHPHSQIHTILDAHHDIQHLPEGYAAQFEMCGPKIQGNPHKLGDYKFYLFDVYSIENHSYVSYAQMLCYAKVFRLNPVPILATGTEFNPDTLEQCAKALLKPRMEGIVVRNMKPDIEPRVSFKVINPMYKD